MSGHPEADIYHRQSFGHASGIGEAPALVIVDFVNGFADPAHFGGGNILSAMNQTVSLLALARKKGWPVAHTRVVYAEDGSDAGVFTLKAPALRTLTETSPLSQIVPALAPATGELVVRKQGASAFFGTSLAAWLAFRRVDTVIVAGCTTSGCVRATVIDSMQNNFRTVCVTDCVGDRAQGPHDGNLFDIGQKYADLMSLAGVAAAVEGRAPAVAPRPTTPAAAAAAPLTTPALPAVLAELREDEAPAEIAAIYAELRKASGVPLVNLIWRHAATIPGALPWMWDVAGPALRSGAVAAAARRVAQTMPVTRLPQVDPLGSGMQLADLGRILDLAETYNRGNLTNLILLTALRRRLSDGPAPQKIPVETAAVPPRMLPPVPPIPRLAALPPPLANAVRALAVRHGASANGVVPSLYLHLALWPVALDAMPHWLGEVLTPEGIARGRDAAVAVAEREAEPIYAMLGDAPAPDAAKAQLLPALQIFTTQVIPAMVPVGLALRKVLAGE